MTGPHIWRTVPLHHLTPFQRLLERVLRGTYIWCPELYEHMEFDPDLRRPGR